MRAIHVITRLIVGGAQQNTIATVIGLQHKPGIETTLVAGPTAGPEGSLESVFRDKPELLTIIPSLIRPVNPTVDLVALFRLTNIFRDARPDIVHTHSGKAGILGRLAARRAKVPIIIHTIHGPSFGQFQGKLANAVFLAAERRAGAVTTHFVSVADAMTRQYLAAGIGSAEQYTRIFSGFELAPFLNASNDPQFRARFGISPSDFVIGKIARLFHLKGHDDLIDAAAGIINKHPQTKFLLVGDGILRAQFQRRVRNEGLEKYFIFAGLVSPEEIPRYIGVMDVVVHLSRREGLARALPQALAARRPVVACDCDGAAEVCITNETGFLIAPGDRDALIERLIQLAKNPVLRRQLGERGQDFARRNFSVETMVDDIYNLYRKMPQVKSS